jgi:hypothetical protein
MARLVWCARIWRVGAYGKGIGGRKIEHGEKEDCKSDYTFHGVYNPRTKLLIAAPASCYGRFMTTSAPLS